MKKGILFFVVFVGTLFLGFLFVPSFEKYYQIAEVNEVQIEALPIQRAKEIVTSAESELPLILWEDNVDEKFSIKLLETGEGFHGDQVNAKSKDTWIGLFIEQNKSFLKSTKINVNTVRDEIVDQDSGTKSGKSVSIENKIKPMFLLRNAGFLKETSIQTLFAGDPGSNEAEENVDQITLRDEFSKEFSLGGELTVLSVKKAKNRKGEKIIALVIERGKSSQVLHVLPYFGNGDYLGTLYWVGDLDQDNKPDFYFDLYVHDNVIDKNLFLSLKAEKGKLLKKVANFWINGC